MSKYTLQVAWSKIEYVHLHYFIVYVFVSSCKLYDREAN